MRVRLRVLRVCLELEEAAILVLLPFLDVQGSPCVQRWLDAVRDAARPDAQIVDALQERLNRPAQVVAGKSAVRAPPRPADVPQEQRSAALSVERRLAVHDTRAEVQFEE